MLQTIPQYLLQRTNVRTTRETRLTPRWSNDHQYTWKPMDVTGTLRSWHPSGIGDSYEFPISHRDCLNLKRHWFALQDHWHLLHSFSELHIPLWPNIYLISPGYTQRSVCLRVAFTQNMNACFAALHSWERLNYAFFGGGQSHAYHKFMINMTNIEENTKHVRRRWRCAGQELRSGWDV